MPSNAAKGTYFRKRTQVWLEKQGYAVAVLEQLRWVMPPGRRPFAVKRDQLGCDLLAVNARHTLFVQVKFRGETGPVDRRFELSLRDARAMFETFPCPPGAEQWLVVWRPRERAPTVHLMRAVRAT